MTYKRLLRAMPTNCYATGLTEITSCVLVQPGDMVVVVRSDFRAGVATRGHVLGTGLGQAGNNEREL